MSSIKLKSLNFELPPFRKLGQLSINFADRITIVAGHNGIGKSTILGLAANGSGLRDATYQSYFSRAFVANLNEIVHLDYAKEFEEYKNNDLELPSPYAEYEIDGELIKKRCSITGRTERKEVRVVPRNDPHKDILDQNGEVRVGKDAKVPLPTIYLGMTRMLPVGESNPTWVTNSLDTTMHPDDSAFIQSFISGVIASNLKNETANTITTQSIKCTRKTAKHPNYSYSAKCISLGQDSLGAIATALASFKKLKREWEEYPGGLLVIDELDAGFHPHAQQRLMQALANAARKLNLQVLATTHSVNLIEAIHPDANPVGPGGKHVDTVIYLTDSASPRVAEDYTLEDIRRDMSLTIPPAVPPEKAKTLKIYLEDAEAHYFLERLLTARFKRRVKREVGVGVKAIPLSMGCENLKGLSRHDPYFKTVLIALDADASVSKAKTNQNIVKLPGATDSTGKGLSPERTLYSFIQALARRNDDFALARAKLAKMRITSDYLRNYLLDGSSNVTNREAAKKWMNARIDNIEQWKIAELWLEEHPTEVAAFEDALIAAAKTVAKLN